MPSSKRIAIIGAGPIGLEAALYGACLGHEVRIFERGRVAENMRRWSFVRMFSPPALNRSALGVRHLRDAGFPIPEETTCPTGAEHVAGYLEPLATTSLLAGRIRERCEVVRVGRELIGKSRPLGRARRHHPFRLLINSPDGEELVEADVVLDCSGTYGHPNWMGGGNIPALGERALRSRIDYTLRDIAGTERDTFSGRSVLLLGTGHSAATALEALIDLTDTRVEWLSRRDSEIPFERVPDDPLPERDRLSRLGNRIASASDGRVRFRPATVVTAVRSNARGLEVTLESRGASETLHVDRVLAHVGFSPDTSIYRELQVHECYASLGPMKLAATLLGDDSGDCLAQSSAGPEVLRNPEPDFYILGAKSYGKNSMFLIRLGLEQVRDVYALIQDRPELNLYAA